MYTLLYTTRYFLFETTGTNRALWLTRYFYPHSLSTIVGPQCVALDDISLFPWKQCDYYAVLLGKPQIVFTKMFIVNCNCKDKMSTLTWKIE